VTHKYNFQADWFFFFTHVFYVRKGTEWRLCRTGSLSLRIQTTTECRFRRSSKGLDVTLSVVFLLTYRLEILLWRNVDLWFSWWFKWVSLFMYIFQFFHNDHEVSLTDDLHYFNGIVYGSNGMTTLSQMLREFWIGVWCLQDRKLFFLNLVLQDLQVRPQSGHVSAHMPLLSYMSTLLYEN